MPIFEGRIFELENAHRYDLNDFHVTKPDSALNADGYANPNGQGSYNRPDSYNLPRDGAPGEIIERKHTQLDEIQPSTWKSYLTQLEQKYAPQRNDIVIADTPSNRAKIEQQGLDPDIIGRPLTGDQIIEVPVQAKAPSVEMLEMADTRRIEVREADGSVWDIAPNGTDVMRIRPDGSVDHCAPGDVV